jgi:hypothetical protein
MKVAIAPQSLFVVCMSHDNMTARFMENVVEDGDKELGQRVLGWAKDNQLFQSAGLLHKLVSAAEFVELWGAELLVKLLGEHGYRWGNRYQLAEELVNA